MPEITEVTVPGEEVESGGAPPAAAPGGPSIFDAVCGISEGDYTGATAIVDAIEAGETSIGVLAGTYDCSTLGNVGGEIGSSTNQISNTSITGLGVVPGDVVFKRPTASPTPLYFGSSLRFTNLTFEDTEHQWNAIGISDVVFDIVDFTRNVTTHHFIDSGGDALKDFAMYRCRFYGTAASTDRVFVYADGFTMTDCKVTDMEGDFVVYGVDGGHGLIHANYFENAYGINIESDGGNHEANFIISENTLTLGAGDRWYCGIQLSSGVSNVDIIGNRLLMVDGIGLNSSHDNVRILDNHIEDTVNAYHGIEIGGVLTDCAIEGNIIKGSNRATMSGIEDFTGHIHNRLSIKNNTIKDFVFYGIGFHTMLNSDISDNTIEGCDIGIGVISDLDATTIKNNKVFNVGVGKPGLDLWDIRNSQVNGNIFRNDSVVATSTGILIGGPAAGSENYDVSHNNITNFATDIVDTPAKAQTLGNL